MKFNKQWYERACSVFKKTWDKILYLRKNGYEHLKPTKRIKKTQSKNLIKIRTEPIKIRTESFDKTQLNMNSNN